MGTWSYGKAWIAAREGLMISYDRISWVSGTGRIGIYWEKGNRVFGFFRSTLQNAYIKQPKLMNLSVFGFSIEIYCQLL